MAPSLPTAPDGARLAFAALLDAPGPRLVLVRGPEHCGQRALVRGCVEAARRRGRWGAPPAWQRFDPAPASLQRRALAAALAPAATLDDLEAHLEADRRPRVLVLDQVHHLLSADDAAGARLAGFWRGVRGRTLPLHLVLLSNEPDVLDTWLPPAGSGPGDAEVVEVGPLEPGAPGSAPDHWTPRDRLLLWCALGGRAERLRHLDPRAGLARNLQRMVLEPDAPLHRGPVEEIVARLQKPDRYLGVLTALARGAREWGEIRAAVPELSAGSRLAPYLGSLEELGWVSSERSLDARPESRRRRYALTDPFTGFWLRAVAPAQGRLQHEAAARVWADDVLPRLEQWAAHLLPEACRRALRRPARAGSGDARRPPLQAPARRTGGVWGEGYDLPLAGILSNGASVHGRTVWGRGADESDAEEVEEQLRRTRFGFGRENRLRLLVSDGPPSEGLVRRAARSRQLRVLRLDDLF